MIKLKIYNHVSVSDAQILILYRFCMSAILKYNMAATMTGDELNSIKS